MASQSETKSAAPATLSPEADPFQSEQPDFVIIQVPDILESRPSQHKDDVKYKAACDAFKQLIEGNPHRRFHVDEISKIAKKTLLAQNKQSRRAAMAVKVDNVNFELEHIRHIVLDFAKDEYVTALKETYKINYMYFVAVHKNDYERQALLIQKAMNTA